MEKQGAGDSPDDRPRCCLGQDYPLQAVLPKGEGLSAFVPQLSLRRGECVEVLTAVMTHLQPSGETEMAPGQRAQ